MIEAGIDAIQVADDYGSNDQPFFSLQDFRKFVYPALERLVNTVHKAGLAQGEKA
ncbi:MAG: uroporphyrinogen decarboxylase family protein [Synergistaceae bacterium]|jgi:uroporphyrinogen-III decarboxylase|nr:uroporphyrinogen decarboxylase family protein [Synergistaceae bacterium]